MTIERSAPKLQILTRYDCPASARAPWSAFGKSATRTGRLCVPWPTTRWCKTSRCQKDLAALGQESEIAATRKPGGELRIRAPGVRVVHSPLRPLPASRQPKRLPVPCRPSRRMDQRGHLGTL
jgi:hypothetical protein